MLFIYFFQFIKCLDQYLEHLVIYMSHNTLQIPIHKYCELFIIQSVFYSLLIPDFALFSLNQPLSAQNKRHAVKALFFRSVLLKLNLLQLKSFQ